jgi:uncharacterized protein (DUF433 family)
MTSVGGTGRSARPKYFDPETETDPVILKYITLPPWGTPKNDPAVTGASGQRYPVWAVYLNYVSAGNDVDRTLWNYGGDLSAEQIEAARRFAQAYPDVVMPYVSAALDE